MDGSDPFQLHDFVSQLTSKLVTLRQRCQVENAEPALEDNVKFMAFVSDCSNDAAQFGNAVDSAVGTPAIPGWPSASDLCSLAMELGLDNALLSLLKTLLPQLQSCTDCTAASSGGAAQTRVPAAAAAAAAAATTAALRAAAERQQPGSSSTIINWEFRTETQGALSVALIVVTAMQQAICFAGTSFPAHKLSLQLLHDSVLMRVLDAAGNRALMHLLYIKVMGHTPVHTIVSSLFLDISNSGLRALHLIISLPAGDQLRALRSLPPRFLDTVCRMHASSLNHALPETQRNFTAIATLATSEQSNSLTVALRHAQQYDPALAASLTACLHTHCMQRITHLSLVYLIPGTATGRIAPCANNISDHGKSPSPKRLKQHNLLSIRLLLESMLKDLDAGHKLLQRADRGSDILYLRLGWSDASTTPSNPHTAEACNAFGKIWGCSSKPEEPMLLSPKATKLSTLIFNIVRLGVWDLQGWGELCCRVVGALLRSCYSLACNPQMRSELGKAMAAVALLANATAKHLLQQPDPDEAGNADLREGTAFFKSFAGKFAPAMNERQTPFDRVVGMRSPMADSLRVLVTQMLRVGKFCNEATWRVTGFTGPMVEGDWHVKLKNSSQINWLLMPGALVTLEMHMRVCAAHILNPKNAPTGANHIGSGAAMSPDLIPLIMAHRQLLARTWIAMISSFDPQQPGTSGPPVFDRYLSGVAGKTLSLTRTLCKLMMLAAGLVSDPNLACTGSRTGASGSGSRGSSTQAAQLEAARCEVAVQAEELACAELQQLFRATNELFTGYGTEEERSPHRRTSSKSAPLVKLAPPREPKERYLAGDLVHATSLRLTLMLGRCCALIALGNRSRGWHMPLSSVARFNNHTGPYGELRAKELAGMQGFLAQARALREGGVFPAAECVERGAKNTFVLTCRTSYFALLHKDALSACGFNVASREAASVPELSNCGFETLLTLRLQSMSLFFLEAGQSAAPLDPGAETPADVYAMECVEWEKYVYQHLTGLAFPGCHNLGCSDFTGFNEAVLPTLLCSGCRRARYCSVRCQQAAWLSGGHSKVCAELAKAGKVPVKKTSGASAAQQRADAAGKAAEKSMFDESMIDFAQSMRHVLSFADSMGPQGLTSGAATSQRQAGPAIVPRVAPPAEGPGSLARGFFAPRAAAASNPRPATASSGGSSSSSAAAKTSPSDDSSTASGSTRLKGGFFDKPASAASKSRPATATTSQQTASQFGFTFGRSTSSSTAAPAAAAAGAATTTSAKSPAAAKTTATAPAATAATAGASNASERPIVHVTSDNLVMLARLINSAKLPTIYDLGGRVFQNYYQGSCHAMDGAGHFDVTVNGTCLRNGIFKMGADDLSKASVRLFGKGVVLEDVRVFGGYGIQVWTDAEVTLIRCWVRNAFEGICTMTNFGHEHIPRKSGSPEGITRLTAHDTKVTDCRVCGIRVERCSEVDLFDCEFSRNISGITLCGNNLSRVRARGVRCVGNSGRGVRMGIGADVVMTECELTNNAGGAMNVDGDGTRLVLAGCLFDGQAVSSNGAKVEVRGREFVKLASAKVCGATWP